MCLLVCVTHLFVSCAYDVCFVAGVEGGAHLQGLPGQLQVPPVHHPDRRPRKGHRLRPHRPKVFQHRAADTPRHAQEGTYHVTNSRASLAINELVCTSMGSFVGAAVVSNVHTSDNVTLG